MDHAHPVQIFRYVALMMAVFVFKPVVLLVEVAVMMMVSPIPTAAVEIAEAILTPAVEISAAILTVTAKIAAAMRTAVVEIGVVVVVTAAAICIVVVVMAAAEGIVAVVMTETIRTGMMARTAKYFAIFLGFRFPLMSRQFRLTAG